MSKEDVTLLPLVALVLQATCLAQTVAPGGPPASSPGGGPPSGGGAPSGGNHPYSWNFLIEANGSGGTMSIGSSSTPWAPSSPTPWYQGSGAGGGFSGTGGAGTTTRVYSGGTAQFRITNQGSGIGSDDDCWPIVTSTAKAESAAGGTALSRQYLQSGGSGSFTWSSTASRAYEGSLSIEHSLQVGSEEIGDATLKAAYGYKVTLTGSWTVGGSQNVTANQGSGWYTLYGIATAVRKGGIANHFETTGMVSPNEEVSFLQPGSFTLGYRVVYEGGGGNP